ncbi:MAG: DUF4325 domain-containing protein [Gammaproteobacteria bacterium]|nr:DUF4325 domain-containing protein [Gammaproteobacteria bacterium]
MAGVRKRGEAIRQFILDNVTHHPSSIVARTAEEFGISRQAVNGHLRRLLAQELLVAQGTTRNRTYRLQVEISVSQGFELSGLQEDLVWRQFVAPNLGVLPDNVLGIWNFGFTEMLNNAIDHSQGGRAIVSLEKTPAFSRISITDDGTGIFVHIQQVLDLLDERHAVLELAKGKLTTDPENHSGEGIFFSSRMFDEYAILSGGGYFFHEFNKPEDWILEREKPADGTSVFMQLGNNSARTARAVFDKYGSGEDYGFDKTVVPVSLARYGNEQLVSRSQAKRLLARVDRFRIVIFDFTGIDYVGQAFADEVFRVFKNRHPRMELYFSAANAAVTDMIVRALGTGKN